MNGSAIKAAKGLATTGTLWLNRCRFSGLCSEALPGSVLDAGEQSVAGTDMNAGITVT